ncbi:MAG: S8 family serine peptidase [Actinomycetota bacterium]
MRRGVLALAIALGGQLPSAGAAPAGAAPAGVERYVVVLERDVARPASIAAEHARKYRLDVGMVYNSAIKGYAATIPAARVGAVRADDRVAYLTPDVEVNAAKRRATTQVVPSGVNRINAEFKQNTGSGAEVAVLDTGIDIDHPDLIDNIRGGKNCSTGPSFDDGNGHGTHVAGTIAAARNRSGVVGVAPDAGLWAVRVLNNAGSGSISSVVCGIDFVDSKSPAKGGSITVANMSLSGSGSDDGQCGSVNNDAMHEAICRTVDDGVTFAVAAGNEDENLAASIPAAYDEVITVSALADSTGTPCGTGGPTTYGADDTFASFSNFAGSSDASHTIAAPGVSIRSTDKNGTYSFKSGTSMAAPHIAGTAALYLAANPGTTPAGVAAALQALGEPKDVSFQDECGTGASHTDPSGLHPEVVVRADTL